VGASTTRAANLIWTNGSDFWQSTTAWCTNGGGTGGFPGPDDNAWFTNGLVGTTPATYTVTLNADAGVNQLFLTNPATTKATITLNLGTNSLSVYKAGSGQPTAVDIAELTRATDTVYLAAIGVGGLFVTNATGDTRLTIGRNGMGTLIVTSGLVAANSTILGNGSSSRGTLVLSGPHTYWTNSLTFSVGNNASSCSNNLVICNSASLTVVGQFKLGANGSSSTNALLLDTGGQLFTRSNATVIGTSGSNNVATVRGGATWDNGGYDLNVGGTGASNQLVIGTGSAVMNINTASVSAANSLILQGGLLQASVVVTNSGTIQGSGTIVGDTVIASGAELAPGSGAAVGTIVLSNDLTLVSGSTTIVKLDSGQPGSNDYLAVVGAMTYGGTLTVIANGSTALAAGDTYKIFAFGSQSGDFTATNLPPLDPSLLWDTSQLDSQGVLAVANVPVAPGITGPTNQAVYVGADVTIIATVTGEPTPTLQWQMDGTNLVGATSSSIMLPDVQLTDSGTYSLIASNSAGVATTSMVLTVSLAPVPPSITGPTDQTVVAGDDGTFTVSVSGLPTPTVQWLENGTNVVGATDSVLVLTSVRYSQNGFVYSVIASNSAGVAISSNATLTVIVAPTIAVQPQDLVVTNAQPASFSVLSTNGVPPPTYQWYKDGSPISSEANATATNDTFTIASAQPSDTATYSAVVSNAAGTATSSSATLTVVSAMTASLTPSNGAIEVCYDAPLYMAFDRTPVLTGTGQVNIYSVTNSVTPVDTIDTSLGSVQSRTIGTETFNTYPVIVTGNTVAIYPHLGALTSNQTYYVTVDTGIVADTNGALFAGITDTNAWRFATKTTGPTDPNNLVVAADGSGDFCTVQGAVDSVPSANTTYTLIKIRNGTYTEIVDVKSKNNLTFRGQDRHQTILTYANNNNLNSGTHYRMAFKVNADDIAIENLTLTNSTPKGGSQAEALTLETNIKRFILNNADVASYQDTILGNTSGTQAYFNNSLIQGDTDFIWGGVNAFFTNCEIRCRSVNSHITQARTDAVSNGISFVNCQLTRASITVSNCDLGRDGGGSYPNGNVAYINCSMDNHIIPAGWIDNGAASSGTLRFWEHQSTDLTGTNLIDVSSRASWSVQLTNGDDRLTLASIATNWLYGWSPQLAPNILTNPVSITVTAGVTATFSVVATGIPDPSYQWRKDGTNLDGAVDATLVIPTALDPDVGTYSVIVSNGAGTVTSDDATLTVVHAPPVADFSASPRSGPRPLTVSFADNSTGVITNRFWVFGDGSTTNTTATSIDYTYTQLGTNGVSLTVFGFDGISSTNQPNYIVVTNVAPQITSGPTVTNALLQSGTTVVVVANQTNEFALTAIDVNGDTLDYQWVFGDGDSTNTSIDGVEHVYTNDCGPYSASATVSDGLASSSNDLTVVVACQMQIDRLRTWLNFRRTGHDRFRIKATIDLPPDFSLAGRVVVVDVGGAQATFTLNARGRGVNAHGACRLSFNKKTNHWTLLFHQGRGDWRALWDAIGLVNHDVARPGTPVTITVVALAGNEGFAVDDAASYRAKGGKYGLAK